MIQQLFMAGPYAFGGAPPRTPAAAWGKCMAMALEQWATLICSIAANSSKRAKVQGCQ